MAAGDQDPARKLARVITAGVQAELKGWNLMASMPGAEIQHLRHRGNLQRNRQRRALAAKPAPVWQSRPLSGASAARKCCCHRLEPEQPVEEGRWPPMTGVGDPGFYSRQS